MLPSVVVSKAVKSACQTRLGSRRRVHEGFPAGGGELAALGLGSAPAGQTPPGHGPLYA